MDNTQKIALQRIKDSDYIKYEGTKEEIELLHSLMERIAKSGYGSEIITGLKKTEELPENHQIVLKIQDIPETGLPAYADGVHNESGTIILFKRGKDPNDPNVSLNLAQTLAHELLHEEQYHQGLVPNSHFTPEQNFIINRLQELDALAFKSGCDDLIKGGFEGVGIGGGLASTNTYNKQALSHSCHCLIQNNPKPDKTFEEIRAIYVKRLGVNIEPEYFSAQTLTNSNSGKKFFNNDKLSIQHETTNMSDGKLSVFKHPVFDLKIYEPKNGKIGIEEKITHSSYGDDSMSIRFFDQQTDKMILGISEDWDGYKIQTEKNPDICTDLKEFEETFAQLNLPKDVLEALSFDAEVIKNQYNEKHAKVTEGYLSLDRSWERPAFEKTKNQDQNAPENVADKLQLLRGLSSTTNPAPQQEHSTQNSSKQSSFSFPLLKGDLSK